MNEHFQEDEREQNENLVHKQTPTRKKETTE